MYRRSLLTVLACLLPLAAQAQPAPPAMPVTGVQSEPLSDPSGIAVLELFTSRSCVFCPQADRLFAELARQPNVIALACHADYFHSADALARNVCIGRQSWYMNLLRGGASYTPQMVFNGADDAIGYKMERVVALLKQARAQGVQRIAISPLSGESYRLDLPPLPQQGLQDYDLAVATVRKPARAAVTTGAYRGEDITYVRAADVLQVLPLRQYKSQSFTLTVPLRGDNDGFVVFLQRPDTGRIAAAGQFALAARP